MSLGGQMFVILGSYALALMFIRGFLYGVKRYQLNNSAYKKRKRQESFKDIKKKFRRYCVYSILLC